MEMSSAPSALTGSFADVSLASSLDDLRTRKEGRADRALSDHGERRK